MEVSRIIKGVIMFILGIGTYIITITAFCTSKGALSIESTIGIILGGITIGTSLLAYGWAIVFEY